MDDLTAIPGASKRLSRTRRRLLKSLPKEAIGAEIGVWLAAFSRPLIRVARPAKLYLIDAWAHFDDPSLGDAIVGRNTQAQMDAAHAHVVRELADEIDRGQVEIRRGRSVEVIAGLPDASLDFAYVDADHSYEGVSADVAALWPKLKTEAWIGFDDYGLGGWWKGGVVRAVNELVGRYPDQLRVHMKLGSQLLLHRGSLDALADAHEVGAEEAGAPKSGKRRRGGADEEEATTR